MAGYPCQHERFIKTEQNDGSEFWGINNVTYCAGQNDVCVSDMIVTIANISLPKPGVVRHEYTDAPLSPQVGYHISWWLVSDHMSFGLNILGAGRQKGVFSLHLYSLSFEPGPISSNAFSLPRCLEASGDSYTFELNFKWILFQIEDWRILSWPDEGDYLFMLWCGRLPILEYNGGIVLSRKRSEKDMPEETHALFRQLAAKHGIDYDKDLCINDNTDCPF